MRPSKAENISNTLSTSHRVSTSSSPVIIVRAEVAMLLLQ